MSTPLTTDYVNLITLRSEQHSIAGTLVGLRGEPRLVMIDDHKVVRAARASHARSSATTTVPG